MVLKWDVQIPELTKKKKRKAYVYLPDSYDQDPGKRYPVLYMFDGHNVFFDSDATYGKSWGMKDYMDQTGTEIIIAAVECNTSPHNDRLREYSPYTFSDPHFGRLKGKGHIYMEWLVNTFKKEIDASFRTLPDREHTFISGSSMGGLMSLYAILEYNHIFSRAAALSPSIWVAKGKIAYLAKDAALDPNTMIYLDYGYEELCDHSGMQFLISKVTSILINRLVNVTSRIIPGGNHSEASWERQIPFFMNLLLYELPEASEEEYEMETPEDDLWFLHTKGITVIE